MKTLELLGAKYGGNCLSTAMLAGHEDAVRLVMKGISSNIDGPLVIRTTFDHLSRTSKEVSKRMYEIVNEQIVAFRAAGR
jgi:hypothetical protein